MNYTATKEEISAELKRLKDLQKNAPREFNRGHFPKGTVALFESPTAGWVKEEDRLYPEQRYELVEETVLSVTSNGPHSYIAKLVKHAHLSFKVVMVSRKVNGFCWNSGLTIWIKQRRLFNYWNKL